MPQQFTIKKWRVDVSQLATLKRELKQAGAEFSIRGTDLDGIWEVSALVPLGSKADVINWSNRPGEKLMTRG
jgi:hypothetical protein